MLCIYIYIYICRSRFQTPGLAPPGLRIANVQAPVENISRGAEPFVGKRIVTSFPALTKKFFDGLSTETSRPTQIKV